MSTNPKKLTAKDILAMDILTPEEMEKRRVNRWGEPWVQDLKSNADMSPFVTNLLLEEPFFGHIFRAVNFEMTEQVDTAGVTVKDGDFHLYWSRFFANALSPKWLFGILKHEAFHLVFEHCTTRRLEPHLAANIAADLAINSGIPHDELPPSAFFPGRKHVLPGNKPDDSAVAKAIAKMPTGQSMEWYFAKLMEDPEAAKEIEAAEEAKANGQPVELDFDSHDGWSDLTPEERDLVRGKVRELLRGAVSKADRGNGWGTVSASMREQLRAMVSNEVDWRAVLRAFVRKSRQGACTSTWTNLHMSNLHEDHGPATPGKRRSYVSNVATYMDHSGSMSDEWVSLLFGELKNFAARTTFPCYVFDTEVQEKTKVVYKGKGRLPALHGVRQACGGTDFDAPTKHANAQKGLDGYIILTDGGAPKPKKSRIKRCYVLAPGCDLAFEPDHEDVVVRMKDDRKD